MMFFPRIHPLANAAIANVSEVARLLICLESGFINGVESPIFSSEIYK
jgi:hypothetical protein